MKNGVYFTRRFYNDQFDKLTVIRLLEPGPYR